jgi:heme a synthase
MARPSVSPTGYRRIALVALVLLTAIVFTGAAVRLTGSGMGCSDWPNCEQGRFIEASNANQAIEQVNRLITGLVSAAVVLAVLGSLARRPRRRDLTWLSLGLVAGVLGQIVLGGIVVLTHVHPMAVQGHFLLSMVILLNAFVLYRRAGEPDGVPLVPVVSPELRRWAVAVLVLVTVAITTGTIVTGTGPHGGDEEARRLGFAITSVARVHSIAVIATVAAALWFLWLAKRDVVAWRRLEDPITTFLWVAVLQGGLGYTQYFTGVPVVLVGAHIVGAVAVWFLAIRVVLACRAPQVAGSDDLAPTTVLSR